jgi:hypothetical protein
MILAFLAVAAFMYWIAITAEPTQVNIAEEPTEDTASAVAAIASDLFLTGPAQYLDRAVSVSAARVSSRLGTQAFWIGPDDRPFLVKMAPELLATNPQVLVEQIVNITGTVRMMTDSALAAWEASGAFPGAGDKIVAEFAVGSPILEATAIAVHRPGEGSGGAGTGGD